MHKLHPTIAKILKLDDKIGEIIFFLMNNMLFLCIHRGFCEKNIIFACSI